MESDARLPDARRIYINNKTNTAALGTAAVMVDLSSEDSEREMERSRKVKRNRTDHQVTAATEHSRLAATANVVFINIDWKSSRMRNQLNTNMKLLANTIAGVVYNMNPTMICMCEVGETRNPLSEEQMLQVVDEVINA